MSTGREIVVGVQEEEVGREVDVEIVGQEDDDALMETPSDDMVLDAALGGLSKIGMRLGFSGILGFCSGLAMKKASRVAMVLIGGTFVGLQGLQYCGYIEIKWKKVRSDLFSLVSRNGNDEITTKDIKYYGHKFLHILRFQLPAGAGFSLGLYMGFMEG